MTSRVYYSIYTNRYGRVEQNILYGDSSVEYKNIHMALSSLLWNKIILALKEDGYNVTINSCKVGGYNFVKLNMSLNNYISSNSIICFTETTAVNQVVLPRYAYRDYFPTACNNYLLPFIGFIYHNSLIENFQLEFLYSIEDIDHYDFIKALYL